MRFGPFPEGFQVLSFAFLCFPQSFTLCAWLRVNDGPSDVGLLCLVYGEPWHVWFSFGSWCRELSQGTLWPASFLLSSESACAEVGSCQVLVLPGCQQQTSCSAPLELVYLGNNLGSSKEKKKFSLVYARGIFTEMMVRFLPWQGKVRGCCYRASDPDHSILVFQRLSFCPLFWTGA